MSASIRRKASVLITLLCMLSVNTVVAANNFDRQFLSIQQAEQLAVEREPGILSAQAKAKSFADKAISSDTLPDPQIRLGLMNLPVNDFNFQQESMTQKQIGLRQVLPRAGSRAATRVMYEQQSYALDYAAQARKLEVLQDVRKIWLELYYWQQAKLTIEKSQSLFAKLVSVTRSLYSVGRQNQQDMVRAELELSHLEDRLFKIDEQILREKAQLAQWIGETVVQKPLSNTLPNWPKPNTLEELKLNLVQHPSLLMANANIKSAQAKLDIAHTQYKPSIALDLNYGIRDNDLLGNERDNFISFMVTMDLPLFTGNRQDKQTSAAQYMHEAIRNEREVLLRKMLQQLQSHYTHWQQLQFRLTLFNQTILKQSQLQSSASLQAYQNDTSDFNGVMRSYITELNTQLEYMRLQVDAIKTLAALDYMTNFIPASD